MEVAAAGSQRLGAAQALELQLARTPTARLIAAEIN
jgi:hypothetical protein